MPGSPDSDDHDDLFQLQHQHLLSCLERTTVSASLIVAYSLAQPAASKFLLGRPLRLPVFNHTCVGLTHRHA